MASVGARGAADAAEGAAAAAAAAAAGAGSPPPRENTRVACVAVMGRSNAPLYVRVFRDVARALPRRPEERVELQMQEVMYNSMDVVEERIAALRAAPLREKDGFLGCLAVVGPLSLYGFVTNTEHKFICALRSGPGVVVGSEFGDGVVKGLFRRLHAAVVGVLMNPFVCVDEPIRCRAFEERVDDLARRFG